MLTTRFELQVAEYSSATEVIQSEVAQADIVEIRGLHPGGIYHSRSIVWRGSLKGFTTPESFIRSKKEAKAILGNMKFLQEEGYYFEIVPLTEELYQEFLKVYTETTLNRPRATIYDLEEQVKGKLHAGLPVYLIGMFQEKDKALVSGLLFSKNSKNEALVSFGAKKKFPSIRGGVGGILEYYLLEYCFKNNLTEISHGKSLNPSGLSGKSGIFEFKARYGFSAFPNEYWVTTFIRDPKSIALSDLVFATIHENQLSYLIVTDLERGDFEKKYKTREVESIQSISYAEVKASFEAFENSLK